MAEFFSIKNRCAEMGFCAFILLRQDELHDGVVVFLAVVDGGLRRTHGVFRVHQQRLLGRKRPVRTEALIAVRSTRGTSSEAASFSSGVGIVELHVYSAVGCLFARKRARETANFP